MAHLPVRRSFHRRLFTALRIILFPLIGFASFLWILIRVIPKPARLTYPCMRAAFPAATGFLLWLGGLCSSAFFIKRMRRQWAFRSKTGVLIALLFLILSAGFTLFVSPHDPLLADDVHFTPTDPPNQPMGQAKGIHPGRVVWAHDPAATSWNGSGSWWQEQYINQQVVRDMMSQSLRSLCGVDDDAAAWTKLFEHFNQTHGLGNSGYQSGEKIAVKLNLNACNSHGNNRNAYYNAPQVVLALLEQLVTRAHVPAEAITFYDATRLVPSTIYDKCKAVYPGVTFEDWDGGQGRKKIAKALSQKMRWSQPLTLEPDGGNPTYIPQCVAQADYLINLGSLKGHNLAGITLAAKNLFGSIIADDINGQLNSSAPKNAGLHPYVCVHSDFHFGGHWDFDKRDMGTYNPLVDLLGHPHLGGKTMLFIIDGLYSAPDQSTELGTSHKWKSFANDWPNSLFLSQDPIALESVCIDFMRNESVQTWLRGNLDNYLHEAALANDPPSKTIYDPDGDGVRIASLGVHEHWNNAQEKKYSRNLNSGDGIELVIAGAATDVEAPIHPPQSHFLLQNYPNPFNAQTRFTYELSVPGFHTLAIHNATGEQVIILSQGISQAGRIEVVWNGLTGSGEPTPSGLYFARLTTSENDEILKVSLIK